MRLYRKATERIAKDIVHTLRSEGHIEVGDDLVHEAELDFMSHMKSYLALDEQILAEAKETLAKRQLPYERLQSVRGALAESRGLKLGDEGIDWIIDQMIEHMMMSRNIEEIFSDDPTLRRKIYLIMKKHLDVEDVIDAEAREKLKHLQEGTPQWDIEYAKEAERIKKLRGLI